MRVRGGRRVCAVVCVLVLMVAASGWAGASPKRKKVVYRENVLMAPVGDRLDYMRVGDDGCVMFWGHLQVTPGSFFDGLEREDTASGPLFRKDGRVVELFPDEVTILISAHLYLCTEDGKTLKAWPPPVPNVLESLRVEVNRFAGLRAVPLEARLTEQKEEPRDPYGWARRIPQMEASTWIYQFVVRTKGTALADPLAVFFYSQDGKKVAQLSLRL